MLAREARRGLAAAHCRWCVWRSAPRAPWCELFFSRLSKDGTSFWTRATATIVSGVGCAAAAAAAAAAACALAAVTVTSAPAIPSAAVPCAAATRALAAAAAATAASALAGITSVHTA